MRFQACAVAVLANAVQGALVSYTEVVSGVQYNVGIPEVAAAPFDVYTSIVSPINMTYAAISFGGCMLRSPILVAWANGTNIAVSPRWATEYHPPQPYNGTTVTVLKTSSVNATHWVANIVCSGCSSWFGGQGAVPAMGSTVFGFGVSNHSLGNPALLSTSIPFHNVNKGHWELNITTARNAAADFKLLTSPM